jgi:hypothetical protein
MIETSDSKLEPAKNLNQGFFEDTEEPTEKVKESSDYTYCTCYGSFKADIDEPEIDLCMVATVKAHGDIKTLNLDSNCACPACLGHINMCPECNGIYLVSGITEDYYQADEDISKEEIDPMIEAVIKATQVWSLNKEAPIHSKK